MINPETPTFTEQSFEKIQQAYINHQRQKYRENIIRVKIDDHKYFTSVGVIKESVLHLPCQLIVWINPNSSYFLSYALQSDGFPYDQIHHPIFAQVVPFDQLKQYEVQGQYLALEIKGNDKLWRIKFDRESLKEDWKKLLSQFKMKRLKKAGQILLGKRKGKIDGISDKLSELDQEDKPRIQKLTVAEVKMPNLLKNSAKIPQQESSKDKLTSSTQKKRQKVAKSINKAKDKVSQKVHKNILPPKAKSRTPSSRKNAGSEDKKILKTPQLNKEESDILEISQEEIWMEKFKNVEKEYNEMMMKKFQKDQQIENLQKQLKKPNQDVALREKLKVLIQKSQQKDREIDRLKQQVDVDKKQEIEESTKQVEKQIEDEKEKDKELEEARRQLDRHLIKQKIKKQVDINPVIHEVIGSMKKKALVRGQTIVQLNKQNVNLREKAKSQSKSSSSKGNKLEAVSEQRQGEYRQI